VSVSRSSDPHLLYIAPTHTVPLSWPQSATLIPSSYLWCPFKPNQPTLIVTPDTGVAPADGRVNRGSIPSSSSGSRPADRRIRRRVSTSHRRCTTGARDTPSLGEVTLAHSPCCLATRTHRSRLIRSKTSCRERWRTATLRLHGFWAAQRTRQRTSPNCTSPYTHFGKENPNPGSRAHLAIGLGCVASGTHSSTDCHMLRSRWATPTGGCCSWPLTV
jgi:hypothetical protein